MWKSKQKTQKKQTSIKIQPAHLHYDITLNPSNVDILLKLTSKYSIF